MTDSLSPDKLQKCANNIQNLEHEIRDVESKTRNILHEAYSYSQDLQIGSSLYEIEDYLRATSHMCETLTKLSSIMKFASEEFGCYAPPFFDFFVSLDIGTWWKQAYPIIEQIATVTGAITGAAAITTAPLAFIKWMRNKLQERKSKDEYTWVKLILNQEGWTISALSEKIDLSKDEAKKVLKGFGYKWDPQKMLYVSTENTQKLRDIDIRKTNLE